MKHRRIPKKPGAVAEVLLATGARCYCQFVSESSWAFFDYCSHTPLALHDVFKLSILYILGVQDLITTDDRWRYLGTINRAIPDPDYFIQDPISPDKFSIYTKGRIRPASYEEIQALERLAAWSPDHIIQLLSDHFSGKANAVHARLAPKRPR